MADDKTLGIVVGQGKRAISAQISPEVYLAGKRAGIKWGYLIEMGIECIGLRHERNKLNQQIEKLQKANAHLQVEILKLQDQRDRAIAETGG